MRGVKELLVAIIWENKISRRAHFCVSQTINVMVSSALTEMGNMLNTLEVVCYWATMETDVHLLVQISYSISDPIVPSNVDCQHRGEESC